jgi:hypothetical protein
VRHEVSLISLVDADLDSSQKALVVLDHPQQYVLGQLLGIFALARASRASCSGVRSSCISKTLVSLALSVNARNWHWC